MAFLLFWTALRLPAATCNPASAILCVGADDIADVWINGHCVDTCSGAFPFVSGGNPAKCVSIDPTWLNASGGNSIAVRVTNTNPTEMWGTWALDITCAGGGHGYTTSSAGFDFYSDPSGLAVPPAQGGLSWFEVGYVPNPAWSPAVPVTGSVYGQRADDPATGVPLQAMAADSAGSGPAAGNVIYFRRDFILTPGPTPVPPTDTPTVTPTPSATPTATESFTRTVTPTSSQTPSITPTFSVSQTFTISPTFSVSPTVTPTFSISQTFTPVLRMEPLALLGLYPNPFSERLKIAFRSGAAGSLWLGVYNVAGERVAGFAVEAIPGVNTISWDGKNDAGAPCASGAYLLRLQSQGALDLGSLWAVAAITR
jgi:hypothetical protein